MKLKMMLAGGLMGAMAFAGSPAHAAVIVAAPGAALAGYPAPVAVTTAGTAVTFINLDPVTEHNVVSAATDHVKRAWCSTTQATNGTCPLFSSGATIAAGETDVVDGTATLPAGSYAYFCQPHNGTMKGTLTVA